MTYDTPEEIPDPEHQPKVAIDLSKAGEDAGNEADRLARLLESEDSLGD